MYLTFKIFGFIKMNNLSEFLISNDSFLEQYGDTQINKIPLLGTHDSACYKLIHGNNKDKLTRILDYARYAGGVVVSIIKEWTLTQKYSLYNQLSLGVRALDLRVTYDTITKGFYFTHTLFCIEARDALLEINRYINDNENVFIMILIKPDYQHKDTFDSDINDNFKRLVNDVFGSKLILRNDIFPTLKECIYKKQHVLCSFTEENINGDNFGWIWGGQLFRGGWIQETDDEYFYQGIKNYVKYANNEHTVNHISIAKTPTTDIIKEDVKNRFTKALFVENKVSLVHKKLSNCLYTPQSLFEYSKKQNSIFQRLMTDSVNEHFSIKGITIWWIDFVDNSKEHYYYSWD